MFKRFIYGLVILIIPLSIFAGFDANNDGGIGKVKVDREGYKSKRKHNKTSHNDSEAQQSAQTSEVVGRERFEGINIKEPDTKIRVNEKSARNKLSNKTSTGSYALKSLERERKVSGIEKHQGASSSVDIEPQYEEGSVKAVRFTRSDQNQSTGFKEPDKVTYKNGKISLEEFKKKYFEEGAKYYLCNIINPQLSIPPSKTNKKDIDELLVEDLSAYKKLLLHGAMKCAMTFPYVNVGRLFNYSKWKDGQFQTYFEFGNTENDSFIVVQAEFGNKIATKYLLLTLDGEFKSIVSANDGSTRFGIIGEDKIDKIKQRIGDTKDSGVPAWLAALISKFFEETFHKKKVSNS